MPNIEIYTKSWCPFCTKAKQLLKRKGLSYQEFDVAADEARLAEMISRSRRRTVPQIFINGLHLGGADDLLAAERSGQLDQLLETATTP